MSFALTATIIFGVVFAIALFIGFVYEKELSEFERIVFRFIRLKIEAKKAGMTVEEYVKAKKAGLYPPSKRPAKIPSTQALKLSWPSNTMR